VRHVFEGYDFNALSFFIFLVIYVWKDIDISFLMSLKSLYFDFYSSNYT
jgi:hypothetical protein